MPAKKGSLETNPFLMPFALDKVVVPSLAPRDEAGEEASTLRRVLEKLKEAQFRVRPGGSRPRYNRLERDEGAKAGKKMPPTHEPKP